MMAILINRTALTMRSVAVAAFIIMLFTPEVVLFPSFLMSFGAVMAIVAFFESEPKFPRFLTRLWEIIATTIVASIPTLIISITMFNQLTLNSVAANTVSIPLMSFVIMPLIVVALFFMIFDVAKPILLAVELGVDLLIKIADKTSRLPGSFFIMPTPTNCALGIVMASGIWLMLIGHRVRLLGIPGIAIGIAYYFLQPLPDIFISPHTKVVGIRTGDAVCFSHLGYFKGITDSWAKSVGFSRREKYNSAACRKVISPIDEDTWVAQINDKKIIVTSSDNQPEDADFIIRLNDRENERSELIYLDKTEKISTEKIRRPWS
jgi:competence protein ComEC